MHGHVWNYITLSLSLSLLVLPDGSVVAEQSNPAVPQSLLREIQQLSAQGETVEEIVDLLRPRTVPPGYVPYTWHPGTYYYYMYIIIIIIIVCYAAMFMYMYLYFSKPLRLLGDLLLMQ